MSQYTRLTVLGSERRLELVSPDDEPVAALIPQVARLLKEPTSAEAHPLAFVRMTGEQLDPGLSLAEQDVLSGEPLRLLRVMDAPPPPEVSDITDVVADERDHNPALFTDRHRRGLSAVLLGALVFIALILFGEAVSSVLQLSGYCGVAVITAVLGRFRQRSLALVGCAITLGAVIPVSIGVADAFLDDIADPLRWVLATLVLGWFGLGLAVGFGLQQRGVAQGAVLGILGALGMLIPLTVGIDLAHTMTIVAISVVLVLGILQWWAMTTSGLTGLDDLVISGKLSDRNRVRDRVEVTYSTLTWSVIALVTILVVCGVQLIQVGSIWTIGVAIAVAIVAILRTRAFPLVPQIVALWLGAASIAAALAVHSLAQSAGWLGIAMVIALILAIIAVVANPAPQVPARLRRLGNSLETIAIVVLVPLALGVLDIYAPLLETFS